MLFPESIALFFQSILEFFKEAFNVPEVPDETASVLQTFWEYLMTFIQQILDKEI